MNRPQDIYMQVGDLTQTAARIADDIAIVQASAETWDLDSLRVDGGSTWTASETHAAILGDLATAEAALRAASGHCEAAWAALGRLASD